MDKVFAFLHKCFGWLPKLGGGKSWMVGSVRVYLWPFVALAIFVGLTLIHYIVTTT